MKTKEFEEKICTNCKNYEKCKQDNYTCIVEEKYRDITITRCKNYKKIEKKYVVFNYKHKQFKYEV